MRSKTKVAWRLSRGSALVDLCQAISNGNSKIYKSDMAMPNIQTRPEVTEHSKATFDKPTASIAFPGDKLKACIPKLGMWDRVCFLHTCSIQKPQFLAIAIRKEK